MNEPPPKLLKLDRTGGAAGDVVGLATKPGTAAAGFSALQLR